MSHTERTPRTRPILFVDDAVRAILAGRKTQTRRKVQFRDWTAWQIERASPDPGGTIFGPGPYFKAPFDDAAGVGVERLRCPYGYPGDRLWVREAWDGDRGWEYRADYEDEPGRCWRPSIHMPRRASRITLEIVSVRVERVNAISEADAEAEGMTSLFGGPWVWAIEFRRVEEGPR